MKHLVIIGGGASGLIAGITAVKNNLKVTILEKNPMCGKKILATGNGKCNYWNSDQNLKHYHSDNKELLENLITPNIKEQALNFFDNLGIYPKIKNGYYYPSSNQALTIRDALVSETKRLGIEIKNNFNVLKLEKINNVFKIYSEKEIITADKVIIATGSKASPKTGSDGMGYKLLKKLGHTIITPYPSLVQVKTKGNFLKNWQGIRTDATVSLYIDNNLIKEETGEIQLTDYGISGICVFNISRYIKKALDNNKKVTIKINFLPFINEELNQFFDNYFKNKPSRFLDQQLTGFLNQKLVTVLLNEISLNNNKTYNNLEKEEKEKLQNILTNFIVSVTDTNSFDQGQVSTGGIPLTEINLETMESKIIKDLYIIGELLDVDGDCGGYNLGFAWMSGIKAGLGCVKND